MTAGAVPLRAAAHAGYYGLMTQLFGAQVRGGESAALVQIATAPIESQPDRYDLFVALDWEKIDRFAAEIALDETTVIIADPDAGPVTPGIAKAKGRVVPLSMSDRRASKLERGMRGRRVNMFAAGAVGTLLGLGNEDLQAAVETIFEGKGAELVAANANGAAACASSAAIRSRPRPIWSNGWRRICNGSAAAWCWARTNSSPSALRSALPMAARRR